MSFRKLATASLLALTALTAAAATTTSTTSTATPPASADGQPSRHGHPWGAPPVSLERFAMENAMVEKLSQQSGKSPADVQALLDKQPPPEVAKSLGIDEATAKTLLDSARQSVIQKAADAQLITAAQAEQLKAAPPPRHHRGMHGPRPDDAGEAGN